VALATDPASLIKEINYAESARDELLVGYEERIARYHGKAYRDTGNNDDPVNIAYEYATLVMPQLVANAPRCVIKGGDDASDLIGDGLASAVNRINRKRKAERPLRQCALDQLFSWGVGWVRGDPMGADSNMPFRDDRGRLSISADDVHGLSDAWWPVIEHLGPTRFILDPLARSFDTARWMGHVWIEDKDDLISRASRDIERFGADSTWLLDEIESLKHDNGRIKNERSHRDRLNRQEIVGYELWIRDAQPDDELTPADGWNGAFVTGVRGSCEGSDYSGGGLTIIRKLRAARIARTGPYALFGSQLVPGEVYPLAPLVAVEPQAKQLNAITTAIRTAAERYKRIVLVPMGMEEEYAKLPSDFVISVPAGAMGPMQPVAFEIAGISDQQLRILAVFQEQVERVLGMDTAQAGQVSGEGTATEVAIADATTQQRTNSVRDGHRTGTTDLMAIQAEYLYHHAGAVVHLGRDSGPRGGSIALGGINADEDLPFSSLDLAYQTMSMERPNAASLRQNTVFIMRFMAEMAPVFRMHPELDARGIIDAVGDSFDMTGLGDLYDEEIASSLTGVESNQKTTNTPRFEITGPDRSGGGQRPPRSEGASRIANAAGGTERREPVATG